MSGILDTLKTASLTLVLPLVKSIGEMEVGVGLEALDVKEGDANFATDLQGMYSILTRVDAALKAGSVPEGVVSALLEACKTSAVKHKITLS